jgi:hypothetical protein
MNKRFIILLFAAILAFAFSDNSQSKESFSFVHAHSLDEVNEISFNEDGPSSVYGIPRQNSYSSPARTVQVAKRPSSTGHNNISSAVKAGKNLDSKVYLHTLALRQCDFSGKFRTQRRLISLRKLVI